MDNQGYEKLSNRLDIIEHSLAELCGLVALAIPPRHKDKLKLEGELTVIFERHFREDDLTGEGNDGSITPAGR